MFHQARRRSISLRHVSARTSFEPRTHFVANLYSEKRIQALSSQGERHLTQATTSHALRNPCGAFQGNRTLTTSLRKMHTTFVLGKHYITNTEYQSRFIGHDSDPLHFYCQSINLAGRRESAHSVKPPSNIRKMIGTERESRTLTPIKAHVPKTCVSSISPFRHYNTTRCRSSGSPPESELPDRMYKLPGTIPCGLHCLVRRTSSCSTEQGNTSQTRSQPLTLGASGVI